MGLLSKLKSFFSPKPINEWFVVSFNDETLTLDVAPPGKEPWQAQIKWNDIRRVCFKAEGIGTSDGIYIFTSERPKSYVVPTEARGGSKLWGEIVRKGLFDSELAIKAASATEGLFCYPEEKTGSS